MLLCLEPNLKTKTGLSTIGLELRQNWCYYTIAVSERMNSHIKELNVWWARPIGGNVAAGVKGFDDEEEEVC